MQIDVNHFFVPQSGSGGIREKHKFQNQLDVFFLLLTVSKIRHEMNSYVSTMWFEVSFHLDVYCRTEDKGGRPWLAGRAAT